MTAKKISRKKIVPKAEVNYEGFAADVGQYRLLKQQSKVTAARVLRLRDRISGYVETHGVQDDKEHVWVTLDEAIDGVTSIQRQKRSTRSLDEERAERLLRKKGLWEQCTKTVTMIDEDELMACVFRGELEESDLDVLFSTKESWALVLVEE